MIFDKNAQLFSLKINWFKIDTLTTSFCIQKLLITFVEDYNNFVEKLKTMKKTQIGLYRNQRLFLC